MAALIFFFVISIFFSFLCSILEAVILSITPSYVSRMQNEKPIIGIKPWASTQVSSVVADNATEMVGWNTNSIVKAIRKHSL